MFKKIISVFKKKNPADKNTFKSQVRVKNVYGDETLGVQQKRFHRVHYVLKYKLVVPVLIIVRKWIDKKLYRKPVGVQFEYVKLWEDCFDEATFSWMKYYLQSLSPVKKSDEELRNLQKNDKFDTFYLNSIKKTASVLFMNDDAYMEWLPFFMYQCYKQMAEKLEKKSFKKRAYHLLHTVPKEFDSDYEQIYLHLKTIKNFEVHNLNQAKNRGQQ